MGFKDKFNFLRNRNKKEEIDTDSSSKWDELQDVPFNETMKTPEVRLISDAERQEFLENGEVEGDPYIYDGKEYQLVPGALEKLGLAPEYEISFLNAKIAFSKAYEVTNGRSAVCAYVKTEKGTKICSYYRSNSQGVWRFLPDYVPPTAEKSNGWYGKGYSEESLTLPAETQAALEIINSEKHAELDEVKSKFAFFGTAKRYDNIFRYLEAMKDKTFKGEFYNEISREPILNFGGQIDKPEPSTLELVGESAPDFSLPSDSTYESQHNIYGTVTSEHFPSCDEKYIYTMNRDKAGRAWLGGIEARTELNSYGLHTEWVAAGPYATPLYEYSGQTGGYGDTEDVRGDYQCMWNNYLSKMPLIQKYLNIIPNEQNP